jgi:hypothetical protein
MLEEENVMIHFPDEYVLKEKYIGEVAEIEGGHF